MKTQRFSKAFSVSVIWVVLNVLTICPAFAQEEPPSQNTEEEATMTEEVSPDETMKDETESGDTTASEQAPPETEGFSARIANFVQQNDLERALTECNAGIEQEPENLYYRKMRASILFDLRQMDEVKAECGRILELDAGYPMAWLLRAKTYEFEGDTEKSLQELNECVRLNPAIAEAYKGRREFFARQGRRDEALADCDRIIQLQPDDAESYVARAEIHQNFDENDQAIAYASKAIEHDPKNLAAFQIRGTSRQLNLDYSGALNDLEEAIRLAPEAGGGYGRRASLYADLGENEKALADFRRALELEPDDYGIATNLAGQLAACSDDRFRDGEEAGRIMDEVLTRSPNEPVIWPTCALAAAEKGDFKEAIRWQQKYLQSKIITPEEREGGEGRLKEYQKGKPIRVIPECFRRASIFNRDGQFDKAVETISKAIALNPKNIEALRTRAEIFRAQDKADQGILDLDEMLRADPDNSDGYAERAMDHLVLGNCDLAWTDAQQALKLSPKSGWAYRVRASIYEEWQRFDLTADDLTKAIELSPGQSSPYRTRAFSYARNHEYEKALTDYDKAIEIAPDLPENYVGRATFFRNRGQFDKALTDLRYVEGGPFNTYACSSLAWIFATCPDETFRDAGKAAEYMDAAMKGMSNNSNLWSTCGVVLAELGDFEGAIAWEEAYREKIHSCGTEQIEDSDRRLAAYRAGQPYREHLLFADKESTASATPSPPAK